MKFYVIKTIDNDNNIVSIIIFAECQKNAVELFKKAFPRWEVLDVYILE